MLSTLSHPQFCSDLASVDGSNGAQQHKHHQNPAISVALDNCICDCKYPLHRLCTVLQRTDNNLHPRVSAIPERMKRFVGGSHGDLHVGGLI